MKIALAVTLVAALVLAVAWSASRSPDPADPPDPPDPPKGESADLESLPYLVYTETKPKDMTKRGVTVHVETDVAKGLNVYKSRNSNMAHLMGMKGKFFHTWKIPSRNVKHVEVNERGELFAIEKDGRLIKIDWDSNKLWEHRHRHHHDVHVESDQLYSFTREVVNVPHGDGEVPILDDFITVLTPDGQLVKQVSLHRLFGASVDPRRLDAVKLAWEKNRGRRPLADSSVYDVLHSNSLERIDRDVDGLAKKGQMLISIREINTVAVVDLELETVVWSWGPGEVQAQHHAVLLKNDRIMIFDNGRRRGHSRVIELDPVTKKIEWEYASQPRRDFFTGIRGGNQRLPNGNTLITQSDSGRVFEVTRDGIIVWEFWNPVTRKQKRAAIYRMDRLAPELASQLPFDEPTKANLRDQGYLPAG